MSKGKITKYIAEPHFEIGSVKAFLFDRYQGFFSSDMLLDAKNMTVNFEICEDTILIPHINQILISVEIIGPPLSINKKRKVKLIVFADNKIVLQQTHSIKKIDETGKCFIGFWLNKSGYLPLKISAQITGQYLDFKVEKFINFTYNGFRPYKEFMSSLIK